MVQFAMHEFDTGRYDLALLLGEIKPEIKRVSFSANPDACSQQPVAIERGGDWGWHLVWLEQEKGIFYARVDSVAWVSSPKKHIGALPAQQVKLKLSGQHLEIHWQDDFGLGFKQTSEDEGRSWH